MSLIDSKIEILSSMAINNLIKVLNGEKVASKKIIDCEFIQRDATTSKYKKNPCLK